MRWKKLVTVAFGIALLAGVAALALTRGPLAPTQVTVAAVARTTLNPSIYGIGTIEARFSYAIGPTQAGRVAKVHVDHGEPVARGMVLVELDPVDLTERLSAASAALARAGHGVAAAEAQIREAASRHRLALANAKRYVELAEQRFVSTEAAENRRTEAAVTAAAEEAASAALAAARRDVERLTGERAAIAKQLANLKLAAPVDGVVVARLAEPGTAVVAGQPVVRLVDPASLWVRARIDQARAGGLAVGQRASIVLRSAQERPIPGRIARIDIESDAVTEERMVQVAFEAQPDVLSLGELAEVTIERAPVADALVVPSAAVKRRDQQIGVWQVRDGRASFQPVRVGVRTLDGQTQVLEGLSPGDEVIVHSAAQLEPSLRVRIAGRG